MTYACDHIQPQLAPELCARMEERVFVTGDQGPIGHRVPDVYVVEYPLRGPVDGTTLAVEEEVEELVEPFIVPLPEVRLTEPYIEIIDASSGNRVVSVIEFPSPTNKLPGEGRGEYLRKRTECCQARVPLVEIDLTRQGPRKQVLPLQSIPVRHHTTYLVCVQRYHPQHRLGKRTDIFRYLPSRRSHQVPSMPDSNAKRRNHFSAPMDETQRPIRHHHTIAGHALDTRSTKPRQWGTEASA